MDSKNTTTKKLPFTPRDALGPTRIETVIVHEKEFFLGIPTDTDRMLNHPQVLADMQYEENMPYWAELWPSARMLAKHIWMQEFTPGQKALEIGCGLGLVGIVALARGLHVTFSDYDGTALEFASENAKRNGFNSFETRQIDWREVPEGLSFDWVFASDLIYEKRNVQPLVAMIAKTLAPKGECLLTDQDRAPAELLKAELREAGLSFTTSLVRAGQPGGDRFKGTLYHIRKS